MNSSRSRERMSSVNYPFQHFPQTVMADALEESDGRFSTGGRNVTNLRLANDIAALAEEEQELEK